MLYTLSYQIYKYEHGLTAARGAADAMTASVQVLSSVR
jgi:hypothetical protein